MKKTLTGFAIVLVAALWMTGSWVFFNSIALGAQTTPATTAKEAKTTTHPMHARHCNWHHCHANFWKQLNLTTAQKKKIKAIRAQARPKIQPLVKELRAGRNELMALRKTGKFDEAKVRAIADQQGKTLANLIVERESVMYKIRAVLTPEQRTKLEQLHKTWRAKHLKQWKEWHKKH
ncbi:MAG: Spy/CpxP family protein refolding chaperone [Deltaproteobacteria bacterium]|jgi:protein CpxP|nr:Spy/CpxP family protein refolding chaperone [Deltaproteobacteria bacterium]